MSTTLVVNTNAFLNALKALVAASVLVLVTGLTSCNKTDSPLDSSAENALYSLTLPDADAAPSELSDTTLQQGCRMHSPESDHRRIGDFGSRFLGRALNLTDTQKTQILAFHRQHEECSKTALVALRSSDSVIFAGYRNTLDSIKTELSLGLIDTTTARSLYRATLADLRAALHDNPDRIRAKAALEECRASFVANIRSILTSEQMDAFDRWLASHKK